jgi:subtilisin family serine protease
MRRQPTVLLCVIASLLAVSADSALAQKMMSRGPSSDIGSKGPMGPTGGGNGPHGGGFRGPGWGGVVPGIIMGLPQGYSSNGVVVDDGPVNNGPRRSQQSNRRGPSGAPPVNERRLVPDEVVIEIPNSVSAQQIDVLQRRHQLTRIETQTFQLTGTTLYRWRIPDRRSVTTVVRELEGDRVVASAQPNYLFTLQQSPTDSQIASAAKSEGDPAQYELARLHLPQAHALAKGDDVLVAVIDSGVDIRHPELAGSVAGVFDTAKEPAAAHKHGTAIAGLVAAHGKLMGAAPAAKVLAVHAFDPNNAGAKSPPLYPAADPNVIAVSATDAEDKLFEQSNRGPYIAVAAPGAQILVAAPDSSYEVSSGTSYSAAEVSGIVALMLQRNPDLTPDKVRNILQATARDLGPKGHDAMFGAGLVDAYGAVTATAAPVASTNPRPVERVSTGAR